MNAEYVHLEHHLIKVLLSDEGYNTYRDYVDLQSMESNMAKVIKLIDKVFSEGGKEAHTEDLKLMLGVHYPSMKKPSKKLVYDLLDKINEIDENTVVHKSVMQGYINKQMAAKLGQLSLKSIDNPESFNVEELKELISKYEKGGNLEEIAFDDFTWDDLMESESDEKGIDWPYDRLTEMFGRLRGGGLHLIVATPNTGKSAFCHTCSTHFAEKVKVLHLNNEERGKKVAYRARCCYTEMTKKEIMFNPDQAKDRWSRVSSNWMFKDEPVLTIPLVRKYIEASEAKIVFIDQAVKIKVKEQGRDDLTRTKIFLELRELAKELDVDIIGVSQAEAGAYSTDFLKMHHIAGSKIGIPGEVDSIIGLVRKDDLPYVNVSAPKAKETGNEDMTHILQLNKKISRMEEVPM